MLAFRKAAKGKRGHNPAAGFEQQIADHLVVLQQELSNHTYTPGKYHNFYIQEPKRRKISAAPFRDRVVHHALCNLIEPIFEARFIADSYANRKGKGTHTAIDRLQDFSRQYRYVLRGDIVKHFPSLDHEILYAEIARVIQDEEVLGLIRTILDSGKDILSAEYEMVYFPGDDLFAINRPRGLPIGNLTSQFWSNVYMNPFDGFIQRELYCSAYLRYVDDFALFSDSKEQLSEWRAALVERLARMRLTIHQNETQVMPTKEGIGWLGFVVYPNHRRLKSRNVVNFTRRFEHNLDLYLTYKSSFGEFQASVKGWINYVCYGDTWGLRRNLFGRHPFKCHPEPKLVRLPRRYSAKAKKPLSKRGTIAGLISVSQAAG